jgi:hypothetical protein
MHNVHGEMILCQRPPEAAHQAGPRRGQCGETPLPGATGWQSVRLVQEQPQLLGHRLIVVEAREQGISRLETAPAQHHQRLQDAPIRGGLGPATRPRGRLRCPGNPIDEPNKADT